jgi:plastocyanin
MRYATICAGRRQRLSQDHVESFTVKRGHIMLVSFTAGKPGVYAVMCTKHLPNMQGTPLVLPK